MAASIGASVRLRAPGPAAPRRAARAPTLRVLAFANGTYTAPSAATAANQLQLLSTMSEIVPDLRGGEVLAEAGQLVRPAAATVSNAVLGDMLGSEALGMKPYQVSYCARSCSRVRCAEGDWYCCRDFRDGVQRSDLQ